jgi:hypothetical protein
MADSDWSGQVFSLDGKLRPSASAIREYESQAVADADLAAPADDSYSPYGAAWKEFDRLQKGAQSRGVVGWVHWGITVIPGLFGLFDPHPHSRRTARIVFISFIAAGAFGTLRARYYASRLKHWVCPRCHAEWPGKKTEKDPRCAVCGLKLHQNWS